MASGDLTTTNGTYSEKPCNIFDGVDDYVAIPHAVQQLGANLTNGFTISAWINPRSVGENNGGVIINKSTSGTAGLNGFYAAMSTIGTRSIRFVINNGTIRTSAALSTTFGVWENWIITVSAGQLVNFYKNGSLSGTANQDLVQGISTITSTNVIRIGNPSATTDRTFDGGIRNVKMWNRVLTTTEITAEYNGTNVTDGLIHHFKLGGDYTDYGSVGVAATNSGSIPNDTAVNQVKTDVSLIKLAAATDKLFCIPNYGRGERFKVLGVNRAA